jgi:dTDP-4-amino-4,6-dideoxygalactose transaminase
MNVPFVDLRTQYSSIKQEILKEINEVLDNTAYICGKKTKLFEKDFSQLLGIKFSAGLSSGTDALHVALHALGITHGDEVIVPVNTFIATSEGVSLCGAKPVFVDNDERTYNIDVNKIEKALNLKTKAIIPVHLYGQPAEMDAILEIANKHGLYVVEDCSQAHLAEYRGEIVGGIGDIGTFSFYPGKNLGAYGEAGAVTTNNEALYNTMLKYRQHGSTEKYVHDIEGHNYRMEEIQAGVLNVKMKYISKWTENRRSIASIYTETFRKMGIKEVVTPYHPDYSEPVYHLYIVRVTNRVKLVEFLTEKGIQTGLHYPIPLHLQNAYSHFGYKKGDFPVAERYADEILSIPMYPEMTEEMVQYVCTSIGEFYS